MSELYNFRLYSKWGLPGSWLIGKESTCNAGDVDLIPGLGRSPGGKMATHSSILAWKIPWTEKPVKPDSPWGGSQESDDLATKPLPPPL